MHRRRFTRLLLWCVPLLVWCRNGWTAVTRRLLPADTELGTLVFEDPAELDSSQLPLSTPEEFGVSGLDDHQVDIASWRLRLDGLVNRPQQYDLTALQARPQHARNLLLICPGTFAYHARWQGVSLWDLLQEAGLDAEATHVAVSGPPEEGKTETFPLEEVRAGSVFLALAVNGRPLPQQHGWPLRLAAEGHVGAEWVKYIYRVEAVRREPERPPAAAPEGGAAFLP